MVWDRRSLDGWMDSASATLLIATANGYGVIWTEPVLSEDLTVLRESRKNHIMMEDEFDELSKDDHYHLIHHHLMRRLTHPES